VASVDADGWLGGGGGGHQVVAGGGGGRRVTTRGGGRRGRWDRTARPKEDEATLLGSGHFPVTFEVPDPRHSSSTCKHS
jgi:hypothetical protein